MFSRNLGLIVSGLFVAMSLLVSFRMVILLGVLFSNLGWNVYLKDLSFDENSLNLSFIHDTSIFSPKTLNSESAISLFTTAIDIDPNQVAGMRGLSIVSALENNLFSLELIDQFLRQSQSRDIDYLIAGELAYINNDEAVALNYWKQIDADDYYFQVGKSYFGPHSSYGRDYDAMERMRLAASAYERVLLINPQRHEVLCPAGEIAYYLNDLEKASQLLEAADSYPIHMTADCYYFLGNIRKNHDDISGALQAFEKAGENGNVHGYLAIGWYYRDLDRCTDALEWFRIAATEYPDQSLPWVGLGYCALKENDLVLAEDYLSSALNLEPKEISALYYLAEVRLKQDRIEDAARYLEQVLRLTDGMPENVPTFWSFLSLANAYAAQLKCDDAYYWYHVAKTIKPKLSTGPVNDAINSTNDRCRFDQP